MSSSSMESSIAFGALIIVECTNVIISTLNKAAMTKGTSNLVLLVYSNALATLLLLLPFLLFSFRDNRVPLSLSMILSFFLLGLNGSVSQILASTGIKYSSPALFSAMSNLIPIFTFLLALIFRMEKLDLKKSSGKAKCVGIILTLSGASLITLYKGPIFINIFSSNPNYDYLINQLQLLNIPHKSNWVFGGFLFLITSFLSATWTIAQASFVLKYPTKKITIVFFYSLFTTLQTATFAVLVETDSVVWQLRSNIEIVTIVLSAILGSVVCVGVHTWCLQRKGPVYVAMFKPLGMIVAVVLTIVFLRDTLYLGSVMGSIVIACGFYTMIWGQIKELNLNLVSNCESHFGCNFDESQSASLLGHSSSLDHT